MYIGVLRYSSGLSPLSLVDVQSLSASMNDKLPGTRSRNKISFALGAVSLTPILLGVIGAESH